MKKTFQVYQKLFLNSIETWASGTRETSITTLGESICCLKATISAATMNEQIKLGVTHAILERNASMVVVACTINNLKYNITTKLDW